jgi:D-alanine transaminase
MLVYLNGEYLPKSEAKVSIDDRGFVFGDGVYEVTRAVDGRLFREDAHWARLEHGMAELRISPAGKVSRELVREVSKNLLRDNDLTRGHATIYLQVTRGCAPRTHWFPPDDTPCTVYLSASPFQIPTEMRENGASAVVLPDIRWARCDIKTVNLLGAVMAKQRAREAGAYDAILVRDGAVTEGGATNVFGVVDGVLRTSPNSNYILPGITREIILGLAVEAGIPVRETPMLLDELHRAEELFFTGTTTDVQPAVQIDGRQVGTGRPGPIAQQLHRGLMKMMAENSIKD